MCYVSVYGGTSAYQASDVIEEGGTLTVGEVIDRLSEFDRSLPVLVVTDDGYGSTRLFGSVDGDSFAEEED